MPSRHNGSYHFLFRKIAISPLELADLCDLYNRNSWPCTRNCSQRQGQDKLFVIVRRPGRLTDIESPLFEIFFYGSALAAIVTILISPLL